MIKIAKYHAGIMEMYHENKEYRTDGWLGCSDAQTLALKTGHFRWVAAKYSSLTNA